MFYVNKISVSDLLAIYVRRRQRVLLCEFLNKLRPNCETRVMLFSLVKGIIMQTKICR